MPRPNLLSLLNSFGRFAKDPAVVESRGYRRESLTYAELRSNAWSWARVLAGHGVGSGDRVLRLRGSPASGPFCFAEPWQSRWMRPRISRSFSVSFVKRR